MAKEKIITNLNEEVQKAEVLKNKVKLANTRIKETVIRGGVTILKVQTKRQNGLKICQENIAKLQSENIIKII